jgi:hypothetical protein
MEASKLPPVIPEAVMLSSIPRAAAAAQAERLGMAAEKALEIPVKRIYEKGGLSREMLLAMGQGTQSKIFIGPEAKTWDQKAAIKAANMERKGATPAEIWAETGTARGPDKMWRQEISDQGAVFRTGSEIQEQGSAAKEEMAQLKELVKPNRSGQKDLFPKLLTEAKQPIKEKIENISGLLKNPYGYGQTSPQFTGNFAELAYQNPELYKAYPELARDVIIRQGMPMQGNMRGSLQGRMMDVPSETIKSGDARSTATHEMQHAIQERERFGVGGNTRDFARMRDAAEYEVVGMNNDLLALSRKIDDPANTAAQKTELRKQYNELLDKRQALVPTAQLDPFEAYVHLMGEAEARLVQRRLDLTPEQRRQNFPFQYTGKTGFGFDVEPSKMIRMTPEGGILDRGLLGKNPMDLLLNNLQK